nr:hypothetical protein [Tanacetum cinerariifolium]
MAGSGGKGFTDEWREILCVAQYFESRGDREVQTVDDIMIELGYNATEYYHYLKPGTNLDYGLVALGSDQDVKELLKYVVRNKISLNIPRSLSEQPLSELSSSAQPESTRKTQPFNDAVSMNEVSEPKKKVMGLVPEE